MIIAESDVWTENIAKLKAYKKKYGNFRVPLNWKEDKQLARWVENICRYPNRLPHQFYKQLVKLQFDFKIYSDWDIMFAKLEQFYHKYGTSYVPPFQFEKLFDWTVNQRLAKSFLTQSQIKKLDSLGFEWEVLTDADIKWHNRYQELVKFKQENGHARVPQYFKENKALGDWVSKQRNKRTKDELSPARIKKLNDVGFLWKEDIAKLREGAWENKYNELVLFKKEYGHINRIEVTHQNYHLGLWMTTQIVRQDKLSPYRKKKLNALEFRWEVGDIHEERWNAMFQKLKNYKAKHGHCRVKQREDFKLSVWLQRNKRDKQKISKDKREKLERLGVKWPYQFFTEAWELRYNELKAFKKEQGHLRVPKSNSKLYEWIETQKKLKKEKTLPKDRLDKLNGLDFLWKGVVEKQKLSIWETYYKKFKNLKDRYGSNYHLKLKKHHPEIDEWVRLQIHSKDKLSAWKKEKLNAIGFLWNRAGYYQNELWEEMFSRLKAYKKKFGNCNVPQSFSKDKRLAQWVNGQRTKELSPDRREKLTKIGFSWAHELLENRWHQRLKEFIDFKQKNKQIVFQSPLYSWLYQQRKNFKKLPDERKKLLLKAGFVLERKKKY